jgi:hypothetical protein
MPAKTNESEAVAADAAAAAAAETAPATTSAPTDSAVQIAETHVAMDTMNDNDDTAKMEVATQSKDPIIKIIPAVPLPEPEPDPNVPLDRDVIVGRETHYATMLLYDLIRIHFYLWKKQQQQKQQQQQEEDVKNVDHDLPKSEKDVEDLASRLTHLILHGRKFELSGLKDVPKPFLKGTGRFFEQVNNGKWQRLEEDAAKSYVAKTILKQFHKLSSEATNAEVNECVDMIYAKRHAKPDEDSHSAPRPCDVLLLPTEYPWEENMAYEHQSGNKHLLMIVAQNVTGETADSDQRVEAAVKLISTQVDVVVGNGDEVAQKDPRFVIQLSQEDSHNIWDEMGLEDLADFAVIFVFEVYLEKQIHRLGANASMSVQMASLSVASTLPSDTPIETPTTHDVLFGRG